jgi:uncharacterized protein GlcG (DUF336 family)
MANTPLRSVRVADEIWQPALAKAEAEGIPLTAVIVTALIEFVNHEHR